METATTTLRKSWNMLNNDRIIMNYWQKNFHKNTWLNKICLQALPLSMNISLLQISGLKIIKFVYQWIDVIVLLHFFTKQLWATRKISQTGKSTEIVVCNLGGTDRNRHPIHAVQRCMQQKEQSTGK